MCHGQRMVYGLWSSIPYWESLQFSRLIIDYHPPVCGISNFSPWHIWWKENMKTITCANIIKYQRASQDNREQAEGVCCRVLPADVPHQSLEGCCWLNVTKNLPRGPQAVKTIHSNRLATKLSVQNIWRTLHQLHDTSFLHWLRKSWLFSGLRLSFFSFTWRTVDMLNLWSLPSYIWSGSTFRC